MNARTLVSSITSGFAAMALSSVLLAAVEPAKPAQRTFATPRAAAEALIAAAEKWDLPALKEILGADGIDLVTTEDAVQDKNQATAFASKAHEKLVIVANKKKPYVATLVVGKDDWPMPIPLVKKDGKWRFDATAGHKETLMRRAGQNELDAIRMCRNFVAAQYEYASTKHDGAQVHQYAQRVLSSDGKQDGLAWRTAEGKWEGPVAEGVARLISEGYHDRREPFHGYYFKVLKGQGPAAALGELDFVVKGAMIGGFALVAAPADYRKTGVKTFIVSHPGIVYEKDLGPGTLDAFKAMERFNPDKSWSPVRAD